MGRTLNDLFHDTIFLSECGGKKSVIYRFSDPDGERSGKSGWSFGMSQFDTQNNSTALKCLAECGFTPAEIAAIVAQTVDVRPFADRLAAHADIIDHYDTAQHSYCLDQALNFAGQRGFPLASPDGILGLADYINQYGVPGDGSAAFYSALGRPVTAQDVYKFKIAQTKYGKEHGDDCLRRYSNLQHVLASVTAGAA